MNHITWRILTAAAAATTKMDSSCKLGWKEWHYEDVDFPHEQKARNETPLILERAITVDLRTLFLKIFLRFYNFQLVVILNFQPMNARYCLIRKWLILALPLLLGCLISCSLYFPRCDMVLRIVHPNHYTLTVFYLFFFFQFIFEFFINN